MPTGIYIRTVEYKRKHSEATKGKSGIYIRTEKHKGKNHGRWTGGISKMKERRLANKDYYKIKQEEWRLKNKDYVNSKQKARRLANKDYFNSKQKERRHKLGINKKYQSELGISYTKEYGRFAGKKRFALERGGGKLSIKTIQLVYEDNIKRYGTLTCYLCEKPIIFDMKDHLEHKIPLIRGGTNEYNNLGIACQHCNCKKGRKTEEEFRIGRVYEM